MAQDTRTESDRPDLTIYDEEIVEVPIQYMRNALWYYDHYFILEDTVSKQDEIITKQSDLLDEWETEFEQLFVEKRIVEAKLQGWKTATIIFGGTTFLLAILFTMDRI